MPRAYLKAKIVVISMGVGLSFSVVNFIRAFTFASGRICNYEQVRRALAVLAS